MGVCFKPIPYTVADRIDPGEDEVLGELYEEMKQQTMMGVSRSAVIEG